MAETIALNVEATKTIGGTKVLDKAFPKDITTDENHSDVLVVPNDAADLELDLFPLGEVATGVLLVLYTTQPLTVKLTLDTNPPIEVNSLMVLTGDIKTIFITVPGDTDAEVHIIAGGEGE